MSQVRVRFAPSPTGPLHIGAARTALFNYLFAKNKKGKFILRIEDTDRTRSTFESEKDIIEGLLWLGLKWDEGPTENQKSKRPLRGDHFVISKNQKYKGKHGPYRQMDRLDIYKKYVQELLDDGKAYFCYCTPQELAKERKEQESKNLPPKYSGRCRKLSNKAIRQFQKQGRKPAVRFKLPEKIVKFRDLIRGEVEFNTTLFGDPIILKSNGIPIYNLANVIDDYAMKITHVIRGEDLLSSTPIQILLYEALGLGNKIPQYAHLPMILNPDRTKMSKRKDPVSITYDFRKKGYLPPAMVNFMVFLGWNPGKGSTREIFTLSELEKEFSLHRVGKSGAIFNIARLDWLNGYYIRKLSLDSLTAQCIPFLKEAKLITKKEITTKKEYIKKVIALEQERIKKLDELPHMIEFFFFKTKDLKYDPKLLIPQKGTASRTLKALGGAQNRLEDITEFKQENLEKNLRDLIEKLEMKSFEVLWPLRVALTGRETSPGVFEVLEVLGKEESLCRIQKAREIL
jgi:glutamyl-tRNA synthetase